jgi:DNA-binding transcriptional MerR regulator
MKDPLHDTKKGNSMKMQTKQYRIGDLAEKIGIERFVIRFWEKEFEIQSCRSSGGQRFYDDKDARKFLRIKELLYEKGFTIAGAKKQLTIEKINPHNPHVVIASQKTELEPDTINALTAHATAQSIEKQIVLLQKKLLKLREVL